MYTTATAIDRRRVTLRTARAAIVGALVGAIAAVLLSALIPPPLAAQRWSHRADSIAADRIAAASAAASSAAPRQAYSSADSARRALVDRYVNDAVAANLALARQRTAAHRADLAVQESRGRFLPSLGVNARYSEFSGVLDIGNFINPAYGALNGLLGEARFPTNISSTLPFRQETKLELVQPLFAPSLFAASAAARAQRDIAGANLAGATRRLAADVQLAWLGYASGIRLIETLDAAVPVLDENIRVSERLVLAGAATPDAVLRARAERSELAQQRAEAIRQRDAAQQGFNLLRDADGDAPIALVADRSSMPGPTVAPALPATPGASGGTAVTEDLRALEASALANREELQQADGVMRLAGAARRNAAAAFLPTVALSASYGVQGDRYRFDRQHDVGLASLTLSWNLFNGGQDRSRIEQASAARTDAELARREAERAVLLDVHNAYSALQSARAAADAASARLAASQQAFRLVERRYAEGLAAQIEFLSARTAFTSAALGEVIARYTVAARAVDLERAAATRTLPNAPR